MLPLSSPFPGEATWSLADSCRHVLKLFHIVSAQLGLISVASVCLPLWLPRRSTRPAVFPSSTRHLLVPSLSSKSGLRVVVSVTTLFCPTLLNLRKARSTRNRRLRKPWLRRKPPLRPMSRRTAPSNARRSQLHAFPLMATTSLRKERYFMRSVSLVSTVSVLHRRA